MLDSYPLGGSIGASTTFADVNGAPANPTTVTLAVRKPDGTLVTYTSTAAQLENPAVGLWRRKIVGDQAGWWHLVWTGAGAVVAVGEDEWTVEPAPGTAPARVVSSSMLEHRIGRILTGREHAILAGLIDQAEGELEAWLRRPITVRTFTDRLTGTSARWDDRGCVRLEQTPVVEVTSVELDGTPVAVDTYAVSRTGVELGMFTVPVTLTGGSGPVLEVEYTAGHDGPNIVGLADAIVTVVRRAFEQGTVDDNSAVATASVEGATWNYTRPLGPLWTEPERWAWSRLKRR